MKRFAALVALLFVSAAALAGGVPPLPNQAPYNDPSQGLAILQQLIGQLNGNPSYAPTQVMGLGQFCSASGATPQTCNGQRGQVVATGVTSAASSAQNFVINDSLITAANMCRTMITAYAGTFGTNGIPVINGSATGTGTITVSVGNANATNALAGNITLSFDCQN